MNPLFNPNVRVKPFDSGRRKDLVLYEVPDASERPRNYLVPAGLHQLLQGCAGCLDETAAANEIAEKSGGDFTAQQVTELMTRFLVPRGILVDPEEIDRPTLCRGRLDRYINGKSIVLSHRMVRPVADKMCWLFGMIPAAVGVISILAAHLWFYCQRAPTVRLADISAGQFLVITALTFVGVVIHEFGHAAALVFAGGARPQIGFGLYLCFPVLFTDFTEAWSASRQQRVIIDLGGLYFQGVFQALVALFCVLHPSPVLATTFLFTDLQIAANLNPFLRTDGYWALADLTGILDLRRKPLKYLKFLFRAAHQKEGVRLGSRARWLLGLYFIAGALFFIAVAVLFSRQCADLAWTFPATVSQWLGTWGTGQSLASMAAATIAVLWRGTMLLAVLVTVLRAGKNLATLAARSHLFAGSDPMEHRR